MGRREKLIWGRRWCHIPLISASGGRGKQISVSSKQAWSTEQVPGQPGPHKETLPEKTKGYLFNRDRLEESPHVPGMTLMSPTAAAEFVGSTGMRI